VYENFYGFTEKPFSLLPDPAFLYLSRQHSMAYAMLEYGIVNKCPISVVTGEVGAGKTTLIRHLLNKLDADLSVGLVTNTHESLGDVLQWVLLAFDLDTSDSDKAARFKRFTDYLISEYSMGRRVVLIIDEAQNLTVEALEEIRLLSNINADKDQVLQLVLVGQPELRDKLNQPQLKQFSQRIGVGYHLNALSEVDANGYLTHRLTRSGGHADLFTEAARKALFDASGGVPRVLNSLADTALVYGFASQANNIGSAIIEEVIRDRRDSGLFFQEPVPDAKASLLDGG